MTHPNHDEPVIAECDDRYDLLGLDVLDPATGEIESFISFDREHIDMPGYVESVERNYVDSHWVTRRIWRTTTRPRELRDTIAALVAYLGLLEKIHVVYGNIVMDTDAQRALHARHVANADAALQLVRIRLDLLTNTGPAADKDGR